LDDFDELEEEQEQQQQQVNGSVGTDVIGTATLAHKEPINQNLNSRFIL